MRAARGRRELESSRSWIDAALLHKRQASRMPSCWFPHFAIGRYWPRTGGEKEYGFEHLMWEWMEAILHRNSLLIMQ